MAHAKNEDVALRTDKLIVDAKGRVYINLGGGASGSSYALNLVNDEGIRLSTTAGKAGILITSKDCNQGGKFQFYHGNDEDAYPRGLILMQNGKALIATENWDTPIRLLSNNGIVIGKTGLTSLDGIDGDVFITIDGSGNMDMAGELKIKVYTQDTEPTLGADQRLAMWIDTNDSNRVYLIFRRGSGDQVSIELT